MMRKWLLVMLVLGALGAGWIRRPAVEQPKRVIGQTVQVEIPEAGLDFLGRVDTGAASTSVHAESVHVEGGKVRFDLINRAGERVTLRKPVAKTHLVRNAERSEERVYVELTLSHDGVSKRVLANLNDRAGLTYALLLGRNWLENDFVVDVSREAVLPETGTAAPEGATGLVSR